MFKNFPKRFYACIIWGFALGIFLAFIFPPVIIAIIEGILLFVLCWCYFR